MSFDEFLGKDDPRPARRTRMAKARRREDKLSKAELEAIRAFGILPNGDQDDLYDERTGTVLPNGGSVGERALRRLRDFIENNREE